MSVSLLIESLDTQKPASTIPIATEDFFETYWLPACKLLGLRWVPLFHSGIIVEKEDFPDVLHELDQLKQFLTLEPAPQLAGAGSGLMLERLDRLVTKLNEIRDDPDLTAYIG